MQTRDRIATLSRSRRRNRLRVGLLVAASFALSCASATRLYPGEVRPREEVGVLKLITNGAITSIGGRKLEGQVYELLPGEYAIEFRAIVQGREYHPSFEGGRETYYCESTLVVEAAHEYQIKRTNPSLPMDTAGRRQTAERGTMIHFTFQVFVVDMGSDGKPLKSEEAACSRPERHNW